MDLSMASQYPQRMTLAFVIVMTLISCSRHLDIRLLPSLVPEDGKNITAQLIEPELEARITKLRNLIDDGVLDDLSNGAFSPLFPLPV